MMVPLKEMAIRVLVNMGELDPQHCDVATMVGALQLRHECPLVWTALLPRLGECTDEELDWLYNGLAFTDEKELDELERILKSRISELPPVLLFNTLEHISFVLSPEEMTESADEAVIGEAEHDAEDDAELASWFEEAGKRFNVMSNAELGKGFCESEQEPVRAAILQVLIPRVTSLPADDVLLFLRDLGYDQTLFKVFSRHGFALEQCTARGLLQAFDAPNARWVFEWCFELLYKHIAEFKRIAGIPE